MEGSIFYTVEMLVFYVSGPVSASQLPYCSACVAPVYLLKYSWDISCYVL